MENLKDKIKTLAEGQSALRNQRKEVHIVGERTMSAYSASNLHYKNRHELRLLYTTQGLLRGRTLEEIEPKNSPETIPLSYYQTHIDKLLAQYATTVVCPD